MANQEFRSEAEQGWEALDRQYRKPLVAFFAKRVGDRADAEDLAQEVFARLSRHPEKRADEGINAYIFAIAQNLLKDWARSRARHHYNAHVSFAELPEELAHSKVLVEDITPERVLAYRDSLGAILNALDELNERTRAIFILSRLEHMQSRDIATLHGISVSAVEKHLMKAVAFLLQRLRNL